MEHFHSLPYAVLGFYKVLESAHPGCKLEEGLVHLLGGSSIEESELRSIGFTRKDSPKKIADFLRNAGRHAVAHAKTKPVVNPDDTGDLKRMSVIASILRAAARLCIKNRFQVGTNRWDQSDLR